MITELHSSLDSLSLHFEKFLFGAAMVCNIWRRPRELCFPVKYYKFVTRDKDSNKLVEYRVEDIPESRYEEACRFMVKHFVPYEPKLVARNGHTDPLVLEDYYHKYMQGIKQKVSLACFKKGSDEFVGVNILEVLGRNDTSFTFDVSSFSHEILFSD